MLAAATRNAIRQTEFRNDPLARRSDHTRSELSELIVDATAMIIANDGLRELTVRKIASKVGYSPGSVYNVFSSLEELVLRVNARTVRALKLELANIPATGDVMVDVKHVLSVYMKFQTKNPNLWAANMDYAKRPDFDQPDYYSEELDPLIDSLAEKLAPAFATGSIQDARYSVHILWGALSGILAVPETSKFLQGQCSDTESMAWNLVENYILGLMSKAKSDLPPMNIDQSFAHEDLD